MSKIIRSILLLIIVCLFFYALIANLNSPSDICLDEYYYVSAAREIIKNPTQEPNLEHHPPLGKYLIGVGIKIFGDYPGAWRIIGVFFSTFGLMITYLLTQKIIPKESANSSSRLQFKYFLPLLVPLLLSCDFLYFTMSRVAMLDIFMTVFILCTVFFLWQYFQTTKKMFLICTAVFFSLALLSKWTALLISPLFLFLLFQKGPKLQLKLKSKKQILTDFMIIALIGLILYLILYSPFLVQSGIFNFFKLQGQVLYRMFWTSDNSKAGTSPFAVFLWPFAPGNTLSYLVEKNGLYYILTLIANPLILWTFWPTVIYNFFKALKEKGLPAQAGLPRFYILTVTFCLYLPWIVMDRVKYFYYMLPVMPFLCILITMTIRDLLNFKISNIIIEKQSNLSEILRTSKKAKKQEFKNKNTNSLNNQITKQLTHQTTKQLDLLDRIIIFQDRASEKIKNSFFFLKIQDCIYGLLSHKKLMFSFVICYLSFVIILFILYYPLLNALPITDQYRKAITFFWPFLFQ